MAGNSSSCSVLGHHQVQGPILGAQGGGEAESGYFSCALSWTALKSQQDGSIYSGVKKWGRKKEGPLFIATTNPGCTGSLSFHVPGTGF